MLYYLSYSLFYPAFGITRESNSESISCSFHVTADFLAGFIKLNHVILGAATKAFWSFCNVVSKLLGVMFVMYFLSQIQVKLAKDNIDLG